MQNLNSNPMKGAIISFVPFFLTAVIVNFFCETVSVTKTVNAAQIITSFPVVSSDGEVVYMPDTVVIYYYKQAVVIQLPFEKLNVINGELVSRKKQYRYFYYHEGEKRGFLYDTLNKHKRLVMGLSVDSIKRNHACVLKLKQAIDSASLVASGKEGAEFLKRYAFNKTLQKEGLDSLYLYANKRYNEIRHSLDPLFEAAEGKVYKAVFIFREYFDSTIQSLIPKRELTYKIEPIRENTDAVKKFIESLQE